MRHVTVFLPTHDGLPHVRECVASLLAQRQVDFDVVVLDDGSTDGTPDALAALAEPRLHIVRASAHRGPGANWNRAIELVETPYFLLAHQDDLYAPQFLGTLVGLLEAHPQAFVAHCKALTIDAAGQPLPSPAERYKEGFWPPAEPYERGGRDELVALRRGSYVMAPAVVYRTAAVRALGPFREDLRQALDWEYWLRGVFAGYTVVGTHRRLLSYRRHARMATRVAEATFSRYLEEVEVLEWAAAEAWRLGLADDPRADHGIVRKLVLSEMARRLAGSDAAAARSLLDFAMAKVPGFAGSPAHRAGQVACAVGTAGGAALQLAERCWLALHGRLRRAPRQPRLDAGATG
jgi:glycosyltransferase involved in cell wall biosynthesis